jgi:hypothetical protein
MTRITSILAAAAVALSVVTPTLASAPTMSPIGSWQLSTGESRFKVAMCGSNGEICAKLVWLRDDARTADNLRYLNTYVVTGAVPTRANRWSGTLSYDGERVGGSMTMLDRNTMRVTGCKLIACTTLELRRV